MFAFIIFIITSSYRISDAIFLTFDFIRFRFLPVLKNINKQLSVIINKLFLYSRGTNEFFRNAADLNIFLSVVLCASRFSERRANW